MRLEKEIENLEKIVDLINEITDQEKWLEFQHPDNIRVYTHFANLGADAFRLLQALRRAAQETPQTPGKIEP